MARIEGGMSEEQLIDAARFLGWLTHDEQGVVTQETRDMARALKGVPYGVMLPSLIATEYDKIRKAAREVKPSGSGN